MDSKRLVEISPLIVAFLVFNGFLKLYLFYSHWDIQIIDYLDFSEILLSFLNDINIFVLCLIVFLIHQTVGLTIIEIADKKLSGKISITSMSLNNFSNSIKSSSQPISDIITIFYEQKTKLMWLISLIVTLIFLTLFFWINSIIWLYLSVFSSLQFLTISLENTIFKSEKLSLEISITLTFLMFTTCISVSDIKDVEVKSRTTNTTVITEDETIITSPSLYLLGKTQKFIYFFDNQKNETRIIPTDKIKRITTVNQSFRTDPKVKMFNNSELKTLPRQTTNISMLENPSETFDMTIIGGWIILTVIFYFLFKRLIKNKAIAKARFFVGYLVLSLLTVLILIGKHLISETYYANVITEIIGIGLTVLIIDRVNHYITNRDEKLYRDIALRHCKTPIYSYCYMWFAIYEPNDTLRKTRLQAFGSLEEFLQSDDFYNSICSFNFVTLIAPGKTYAQYYAEKLNQTEESFQNILAKYASKVSTQDIQKFEFFGGGSHLYKVFRVMDFLRAAVVSTPTGTFTNINNFSDVSRQNFQKHFHKLTELINDYNSVVDEHEKWTLETLNKLTTLSGSNTDTYDW